MQVIRIGLKGKPGPVVFRAACGWPPRKKKIVRKAFKLRRGNKMSRHQKHLLEQHLQWMALKQKGLSEPMGAGERWSSITVESLDTKQENCLSRELDRSIHS